MSSMGSEDDKYNFIWDYFSKMGEDMFYTECFMKDKTMGEMYLGFTNQPTVEAKFLYTFNLLRKYNKLPIRYEGREPKSDKKACSIRTMGNIRFQNKDYVRALREYNVSVMTAKPNSEDYVYGLANRSAALYYLEEYNDCICDIHRALATNYPESMAYKLYEREIKCLKNMGKISEAKSKFEVSIVLTDYVPIALPINILY